MIVRSGDKLLLLGRNGDHVGTWFFEFTADPATLQQALDVARDALLTARDLSDKTQHQAMLNEARQILTQVSVDEHTERLLLFLNQFPDEAVVCGLDLQREDRLRRLEYDVI